MSVSFILVSYFLREPIQYAIIFLPLIHLPHPLPLTPPFAALLLTVEFGHAESMLSCKSSLKGLTLSLPSSPPPPCPSPCLSHLTLKHPEPANVLALKVWLNKQKCRVLSCLVLHLSVEV